MTRQRVDLARLRDVVDQMARFDTGMETALADVDRRVTRLHTQWTGRAAEEHRAAHQRWLRGAAEMRQALTVMRGIAEGAHGNFGDASPVLAFAPTAWAAFVHATQAGDFDQ